MTVLEIASVNKASETGNKQRVTEAYIKIQITNNAVSVLLCDETIILFNFYSYELQILNTEVDNISINLIGIGIYPRHIIMLSDKKKNTVLKLQQPFKVHFFPQKKSHSYAKHKNFIFFFYFG